MKKQICPLQKMLNSVGGKWKLLILFNLKQHGKVRFGNLRKMMPGISQKVLTSQLKELEVDGFVYREVFPEIPPRVEYSLSTSGETLYPVLDAMSLWAGNYFKEDKGKE